MLHGRRVRGRRRAQAAGAAVGGMWTGREGRPLWEMRFGQITCRRE